MKLVSDTKLEPRVYEVTPEELAGGQSLIEICSDNLVLDLNGAVIDGKDFRNYGIYIHDCRNVTIINGMIKGFYYGIYAENVSNLRVENNVVSHNYNDPNRGWLDDGLNPNENGFGGGIYLFHVNDSSIVNNIINSNFNGIYLIRSSHNKIEKNNASFSGNVGIYLLGSCNNEILENIVDSCIRYGGRFWCDTCDSAGVLLEEYSHYNRITDNSMKYSGDGFFIRALNRHSSNHNYIARNDASFSPNNAFEAVFSEYNTFEDNIANFSNFGFWLGYSRHNVVKRNEIRHNRYDGIAIEHGSYNDIIRNEIENCRYGIFLFWDDKPDLGNDPSEYYLVKRNNIAECRLAGINLRDTVHVRLRKNSYAGNTKDLITQFSGRIGDPDLVIEE